MKYVVCVRVDGYVSVPVEAEDEAAAKSVAANEVGEMDFGALRDIEWEPIHAVVKED
jgi:hypothetical protein